MTELDQLSVIWRGVMEKVFLKAEHLIDAAHVCWVNAETFLQVQSSFLTDTPTYLADNDPGLFTILPGESDDDVGDQSQVRLLVQSNPGHERDVEDGHIWPRDIVMLNARLLTLSVPVVTFQFVDRFFVRCSQRRPL